MSENAVAGTDKGIGLAIVFTAIAVVGALGMLGSSYLSAVNHIEGMQLLSGLSLTVALIAGGLAITVLHVYR